MVFSAVSMVSSFEADDNTHDLVGVGEKIKTKTKQNKQQLYASLRHIFDAARSKMKAEWGGNRSAHLLYPNRKETVR